MKGGQDLYIRYRYRCKSLIIWASKIHDFKYQRFTTIYKDTKIRKLDFSLYLELLLNYVLNFSRLSGFKNGKHIAMFPDDQHTIISRSRHSFQVYSTFLDQGVNN